MDLKASNQQPSSGAGEEEGELEDGEICDDETEESLPLGRGDGNRPPRSTSGNIPGNIPPLMNRDFCGMMPFPPHRGPFPLGHRQQQSGPSGPDRPVTSSPASMPLPLPLPLPLPTPQTSGHALAHGDPTQRSNFWERSHGALGRFRHNRGGRGGGDWKRGGNNSNRGPGGRYISNEVHGNKKESPSRKQKPTGRNQPRKLLYTVAKPETSVEETFEDLLSRYKQIQLELECIRKEETMALEPKVSPTRQTPTEKNNNENNENSCKNASIKEPMQCEQASIQKSEESNQEINEKDKKVFHAFNIKPLRQKVTANLDELKKMWAEEAEGTDANKEDEEVKIQDGGEIATKTTKSKEKTCIRCGSESKTENKDTQKVSKPAEEAGTAEVTCVCCGDTGENTKMQETQSKRESSVSSVESSPSTDKPLPKVEEEELSELQLRLLALQSASKKWHQKEQQVMKKSKDRIINSTQNKSAPSTSAPSTTSAPNRQRVNTRSSSASSTPPADRTRTRRRTNSQVKQAANSEM